MQEMEGTDNRYLGEKRGVEAPEMSSLTAFHRHGATRHVTPHHSRAHMDHLYSTMPFEGENNYRMTTSKLGEDTVLRGLLCQGRKSNSSS